MTGCCDPGSYRKTFDDAYARSRASGYRKDGLSKTAQRVVDLITGHGIEGATVLEVGGGVGDLHLELLKRGAARATALELSDSYQEQAEQLLAESGLGSRVERRIVDLAAAPDDIEPADVVVLNRVVCCYPDYETLLGAAADHTRQLLVFSHPPRNVVSRTVTGAENLGYRLRRNPFRVYAHPPQPMLDVLQSHGLRTTGVQRSGLAWRIAAAVR